jgi:aminoglycoside phosphotransferase (APT) family kinase protein
MRRPPHLSARVAAARSTVWVVTGTSGESDKALAAWIERTIGGTVVRMQRHARWRAAWDIDLDQNGVILPLHARGDREANFAIPYRIADELPTHHLLERAGIPVPHAYGLCEEPYVLVMDRLPGHVELSFADSDRQRTALIDEYLELLPAIYAIDLEDAAAAGFEVPADAEGIALGSFTRFERAYDELQTTPDPVAEFLRGWVHRHFPPDRTTPRFVTCDAFQFMFEDGKITGLLDFELAHVGDPLMDLAFLRIRDTIKSLGDLAAIAERFGEITGVVIDHDAVDFYTVMYNVLTVLSASPPLADPTPTTDLMSHLAWYVNSARWAFEVIADLAGIELSAVDSPPASGSRHHAAFAHLARGTRAAAATDTGYDSASLHRVARHLLRIDEIGRAVDEAGLDDLEALLGKRPTTDAADAELLAFIAAAGTEHDDALVRLLDRRVQRQQLLMAPTGSLMLRHPRLRSVRPDAADLSRDEDRWPPGAIPGTA